MNILILFLIYLVVLGLGVLSFLIRNWIKIGLTILFKKKSLVFIVNNDRRIVPYAVKIDDKKINIDNSIYFIEPSRVNFFSMLKSFTRRGRIKKQDEIKNQNKNNQNKYNISLRKTIFFGNTPCYIFREGNPEPLDIYRLSQLYQEGKTKAKSIISGRYLSDFYAKIQYAKQLEIFDKLQKYAWVFIILAIIIIGAVAYLIIFGITPQIASGSGSQILTV